MKVTDTATITKCENCGSENLATNKVQYQYKKDRTYLFLNNVPCVECQDCGEQHFDTFVVSRIEEEVIDVYILDEEEEDELEAEEKE